jgi:glycosyltransferase involved in cell wall biosynthesis
LYRQETPLTKNKMKVGFAGRWSPMDRNAWSGTYFNSYNAIKKYYDTEIFFYKWPWYVRESLILHKQFQKISNKKAAVEFLKGYAKYFSKQLEKDLLKRKVDLLFVPGAPQLIAYCNTNIPIIYLADATFLQLQGYYPLFKDIAPYNIEQGITFDKLALQKATHCILCSEWAKRSAINDYGIVQNSITVAALGANLDIIPAVDEFKQQDNTCRLFFLGVEWKRKGGPLALEAFFLLKKAGLKVHLTIAGCTPPNYIEGKYENDITVIPFINKNNKEEAALLNKLFTTSNFLLLPTRAECAGIAYSEASAFGLPSITTDTGGVKTYVEDGINGFTLPIDATAAAYAEKIIELFSDKEKYNRLRKSTRKKYEAELNWDTWGKTFHTIAEKIMHQ